MGEHRSRSRHAGSPGPLFVQLVSSALPCPGLCALPLPAGAVLLGRLPEGQRERDPAGPSIGVTDPPSASFFHR